MDLETHTRRQGGAISREQARGAGLSDDAIRRRVRSGAWRTLTPSSWSVGPPTPEGRVHGVALWAGPDATVGGLTAGWWWGLVDEPPGTVEVRSLRRLTAPPGARLARIPVPAADRVHRRGVAVTGLARTVLDVAVELGDERGQAVLDRALRRHVSFDELRRAHCRALGRAGSPAAARFLRTSADGAASEPERRVIRILRDAGITGWEANAVLTLPGGTREVDLLFREARLALEVDGWAWHVDHDRFHADRERQNALVLAGWRVIRLTWRDTRDPARVVAIVRAALALAS